MRTALLLAAALLAGGCLSFDTDGKVFACNPDTGEDCGDETTGTTATTSLTTGGIGTIGGGGSAGATGAGLVLSALLVLALRPRVVRVRRTARRRR